MFMMMMITNALPSQSNGFGISPLDLISSQEKLVKPSTISKLSGRALVNF